MSGKQCCTECKATETSQFHTVQGNKWREAVNRGLVKATWDEGIVLCNGCYMKWIENPLSGRVKRVKVTDGRQVSTKIDLTKAIEALGRILYKREHTEKESPIYEFDALRNLLQTEEPSLKAFFDQLYSAARPSERNEQMMDRMKRLMVFICYLLASLNNTKINCFKFDLAYYLDSAGTSNEGIK